MKFNDLWDKITKNKPSMYITNTKNITTVLKMLGNPQYSYKTIHIGGTNGKGSTSNFLYSYLKTKYKTALFISPSVLFETEMAKVNDYYISKDDFVRIYKQNEMFINKYNLTFFEIKTLISFLWFKEQKVDYAIIEVGLGGEYDATNTLIPEACIITNIGDDHSKHLGDSFEKKALTKLGIQKPNIPLFTSEPKLKDLSLYPQNIILNTFEFNFTNFAKYQKQNYNIAIQLLVYLGFDKQEVSKVIQNTKLLPYRYQKIKDNIYFDACHNYHGAKALVDSLSPNQNYVFILSTQSQKNYLQMIELLKTKGDLYLTNFNFENSIFSFDAEKVSNETNTKYLEDISKITFDNDKTYIFVGSFYFLNTI